MFLSDFLWVTFWLLKLTHWCWSRAIDLWSCLFIKHKRSSHMYKNFRRFFQSIIGITKSRRCCSVQGRCTQLMKITNYIQPYFLGIHPTQVHYDSHCSFFFLVMQGRHSFYLLLLNFFIWYEFVNLSALPQLRV